MNADIFTPEARRRELVIQELADEVLIYDLETNRAVCLNGTAALVWQNCDGYNSVARIAALLSKKLKTPIETPVVWFALHELEAENLLENPVAAPAVLRGMNRRQLIGAMGKSVAVALPVVIAITAPAAAAAASPGACRSNGSSCSSNGQCCSNVCASGVCRCLVQNQACSSNIECCNGRCVGGFCIDPGGGCVLYDTPIIRADGRAVRAADVFIGQELLGINCVNGEKVAGRVKNLRRFRADEFYSLTTASGDTVHCSASHPLINGFGDKWGKEARLFKTGDALLVYDEKSCRVVEAETVCVERIDVPQPVIIFEMDTREHTFISGGIVSHNKPE